MLGVKSRHAVLRRMISLGGISMSEAWLLDAAQGLMDMDAGVGQGGSLTGFARHPAEGTSSRAGGPRKAGIPARRM